MERMIITGASGSLGSALAAEAVSRGIEVLGISKDPCSVEGVSHLEVDLGSEAGISEALEWIGDADFDAFVSCAGILAVESLVKATYAQVDRQLSVNLAAPLMLVSGLASRIREQGSDVVIVGSTLAHKTYLHHSAYHASKWGLRGLIESLRAEFSGSRTRVIGFHPGAFVSDFFKKGSGIDRPSEGHMDPRVLARLVFSLLELPKSVEVSDIVVNRNAF